MSQQTTVIVSGCAGFIGSHLTEQLVSLDYHVIGLDNFETGKHNNMHAFLDKKNFEFHSVDISNDEHINHFRNMNYKRDIDVIFHVGAKARIQPSIDDPRRTITCNVNGTFNMLELARDLHIERFVYSASSSAYGLTDKLPNTVGDPENCLNPYSVTKLMGEKLCRAWSICYGLNTISLRYFNVYGERSPLIGNYAPVIGIFYRQLLKDKTPMTIVGTGQKRRDFTHVNDVVSANIHAYKNCSVYPGRTFNVGCGVNYSIKEIAQMVGGDNYIHIPDRQAEAQETLAYIEDTKACLDYWAPTIQLPEGIEIMRDYYTNLFA